MGRKRTDVVSLFQLKKCAKMGCDVKDRISQLSDDILISILCCLPLREAALTSAVSSRWRNLWKYTPWLNFDADSVLNNIPKIEGRVDLVEWLNQRLEASNKYVELVNQRRLESDEFVEWLNQRRVESDKYVEWVNQVVQSHKALALKEFRVCFFLDTSSATSITKWLEFAFSRQVERLELDLLSGFLRGGLYDFPNKFIGGRTLKALSLKGVIVTDEAVEFLLHNCPLLEHLVIHNSSYLENIEVCGQSLMLKHMELVECFGLRSIKVSAPNLSSLTCLIGSSVVFENVSSLVQLHLFCLDLSYFTNTIVSLFSPSFSLLEVLTLFTGDLYSFYEALNIIKFPRLKRFEIEMRVRKHQTPLFWLTSFLRASPYLQEFVLKCYWFVQPPLINPQEIGIQQFCHQHLKVFKFLGYFGSSSDLELVGFISANCVVLEKMVIDPHCQDQIAATAVSPLGIREERIARNNVNELIQAQVVPHHIQLLVI